MMVDPAERDERVMTLAAAALKTPVHERDSFLRNACQNDAELYREVSEVVAWEERMRGFLSRPLIELVDLEALERIFQPGRVITSRFEILRCVGDGGMGVVYEALDRKRRQRIAIKFAKPGFGRLLPPELEGALKVRHPNICVVNEIHAAETEFGELNFLTMEFLDGETLSRKLAQGKLDETEALEIARQLCAGVVEAHRSGILHRDLKPGNVILCRNHDGSSRAVITDFGLSTESALAGTVGAGTPSYMAPELWRNERASPASDVFSLGVILYEMVTGQKPFPAAADGNAAPTPAAPSKLVRHLPRRWDKAILPCLRPKPEERCSAQQILQALAHRPFYRRPAPLLAMAACLGMAALVAPKIIAIFAPPPIRLAMLPVDAPQNLLPRSHEILDDVSAQLQKVQVGKPTAAVVSLSRVLSKRVSTPQEAGTALGATHVLQLKLRPTSDGWAAEGAIIDVRTMARLRDYSGNFTEADLSDLSSGLTGLASWALHLHRAGSPETVAPPAVASYKHGREYLRTEPAEFTQAIGEFQKALRLDPHSPLPSAGLAEAYARKYQFQGDDKARQDAHMWLDKAGALNPDSPAVRMASGLLYTIQGDYPRALEDYQRVEETEPNNSDAWLGSGLAYKAQGMPEKAIADYSHAISINPAYYKPYEYLGALHYSYGRYDRAEELYKKDIESAPDRVERYGLLADAYIAEGKYSEAEKVYKASLERKETPVILNNIGAMLAFQGRQEAAASYYRRAIAMNPHWTIYWLNLGDAQRRLKDQVNARDSYRHALAEARAQVTANTSSAWARALLAYLDVRLGFTDQARSEIAEALNSPARDDQVILSAVETYEALGDRERALAAAAMATGQTRNLMNHHPDLGGLQADPRFEALINQVK